MNASTTMDIRIFFHPKTKTKTETCPVPMWVEKFIMWVLRHGSFRNVKFNLTTRNRFVVEVAKEFIPMLDEFDPEWRDQEAVEVMRELIKDWMEDNYTSWK